MKIISHIQQNTPEWVEFRRNKLGASSAPIIMGVSPWCTPYMLHRRMLGLESEQPMSDAMKRGHALEDEARQLFNQITECLFFPSVIQHEKYDWMIASLDGLAKIGVIFDKEDRNKTSGIYSALEIKAPGQRDHDTAKLDLIPPKYYPQLQHQLAVTGLDEMYYMSYVSPIDYKILTVKRDDRYIEELIEKELEFMEMLENLTPPPLTDKDYMLRLDADWEKCCKEYRYHTEGVKIHEEGRENARKRLIELSGNANSLGGGLKLTKYARRGSIKYDSIPELQGVDLEKYRGTITEQWRITEISDKEE